MGVRPAFVLALWVDISVAGCGSEPPSYPRGFDPSKVTNPDYEILDSVLPDLLDNKDFDPAVGGRGIPKSQVLMSETTSGGLSERLSPNDICGKSDRISSDLRADIARRNPNRKTYSLKKYHPKAKNVKVVNLKENELDVGPFSLAYPEARGYVSPYLPGYSRDGTTALFRFQFGPTAHGAVGCYLLRYVDGRWEIVERHLGYFD